MCRDVSARLQHWKAAVPGRQRVCFFDPVLREYRLEPVHDRSFQPYAGVAKLLWTSAVTEPVVRDAVTERITDASVDDEQLTMRAIVEPADVPPARLAIGRNLAAAAPQPL